MSNRTHAGPCSECGARNYSVNYFEPIRSRLVNDSLCFECDFWRCICSTAGQKVIVGNIVYQPAPEQPQGYRGFLGFGGQRFDIEFLDGRRMTSTNLWCNGHIPERFKSRLPDNARFLSNAEARECLPTLALGEVK